MSSPQADIYWAPIQAPLEDLWRALLEESLQSRELSTRISSIYSRIVSVSSKNYPAFYRTVYGEWQQLGQLAGCGSLYVWAQSLFSQRIKVAEPLHQASLDALVTLAKNVNTFQLICKVAFSLCDKMRLDRKNTMVSGIAPSVPEIIEVAFWCDLLGYQQPLVDYLCRRITDMRTGSVHQGCSGTWGALRLLTKFSEPLHQPTPNSCPRINQFREERRKCFHDILLVLYMKSMLGYYSEQIQGQLFHAEPVFYIKWATNAVATEKRFLDLSKFPKVESQIVIKSLLQLLVGNNESTVLSISNAPRNLLAAGDLDSLSLLWKLFKMLINSVHSSIGNDILRRIGDDLKEGAKIAATTKVKASDSIPEITLSLANLWEGLKLFSVEVFAGYGLLLEQVRLGISCALEGSLPRWVSSTLDTLVLHPEKLNIGDSEVYPTMRKVVGLSELTTELDALTFELKHRLGSRLIQAHGSNSFDAERQLLTLLRASPGCQSMSSGLSAMVNDAEGSLSTDLQYQSSKLDMPVKQTLLLLKKVNWISYVTCSEYSNGFLASVQHNTRTWYAQFHRSGTIATALEVTISVVPGQTKRKVDYVGSHREVTDVLLAVSKAAAPPTLSEVSTFLSLTTTQVRLAFLFLRGRGVLKTCESDALHANSHLQIDSSNTPKARKVSITPLLTKDEVRANQVQTSTDLTNFRKSQVQIALVRVMKRRIGEAVNHQLLVTECLDLISGFTPQISDIKLQIEDLIRKDIIERDGRPTSTGAYRYKV